MGRSAPFHPLAPGRRQPKPLQEHPLGVGGPQPRRGPPRPHHRGQPDPGPKPCTLCSGSGRSSWRGNEEERGKKEIDVQFHVAPQPLHFMPQRRCVRFSKLLRRLLLPLPFPPPPQLPFQAGTRGQGAALRGSPGVPRKEPWLQGRSSSSRGSRPRCPVSFWPPACSSRVFLLLLLRVPPKNPAPCSHPTPLPTASPLTGQEQKAQELPAACPPQPAGAPRDLPALSCTPCASRDAHGPAAKPWAPCAHFQLWSTLSLHVLALSPSPGTGRPFPRRGVNRGTPVWHHPTSAPRAAGTHGLPHPGGCALGRGPGMLLVLLARSWSSPFCSRSNLTKTLIKELL